MSRHHQQGPRRARPPGRPGWTDSEHPCHLSRRELLHLLGGLAVGAGLAGEGSPLLAQAPDDTSPPTGTPRDETHSDLGSLYPFIQAQADRSPLALSYLRGDFPDLADWQAKARSRITELLHYDPGRVAPAPKTLDTQETAHFTRRKLTFATSADGQVPAYLLVPKGVGLPAPGVVVLHDHGGFYYFGKEKVVALAGELAVLTNFKRRYYSGRSIADELARRGYVVLVVDAFYFGERRLITPSEAAVAPGSITDEDIETLNRRNGEMEELVARALLTAGVTWMGVTHWDDRRSLDLLAGLPEVDAERLACVGLSVGGYRSLFLAAMDERIKVGVDAGWMTRLAPCIRKHIKWTVGFTKLIPGLYHDMDLPDVATLIAPRAFLCVNGTEDWLFPPQAVSQAHEDIARGYAKAGCAERFRSILYKGPHEFNAEMQEEAWAWLARWL